MSLAICLFSFYGRRFANIGPILILITDSESEENSALFLFSFAYTKYWFKRVVWPLLRFCHQGGVWVFSFLGSENRCHGWTRSGQFDKGDSFPTPNCPYNPPNGPPTLFAPYMWNMLPFVYKFHMFSRVFIRLC